MKATLNSVNSLKVIQTISNIMKIVTKIISICSIIGAIGCAIGIASYGLFDQISIGGITIHNIVQAEAGESVGTVYTSMIVALILCIGAILTANRANKYFTKELEAGTPFTMELSNDLFQTGIFVSITSLITMVVANVAYCISNIYFEDVAEMHIDAYGISFGMGIIFILISLFCKQGAEFKSEM